MRCASCGSPDVKYKRCIFDMADSGRAWMDTDGDGSVAITSVPVPAPPWLKFKAMPPLANSKDYDTLEGSEVYHSSF
jgi:hypothetical protein